MIRTLVAMLAALMLCTVVTGCGSGDGDGARKPDERPVPETKRTPPGPTDGASPGEEAPGDTDSGGGG